jgi:hypothetical protein
MKRLLVVFLALVCGIPMSAQSPCDSCPGAKKKKGSFYFLWGYNRDWYAKSTLHFFNPHGDPNKQDQFGVYDFKIYDVTAHDRPDFDAIKDVVNITIPQFNARLGYYFNDKKDQGVEINYDHAKYVVDDHQTAHFKGTVFGVPVDKDSILDPKYIHFEHTDGANFWCFNYIKRWKLLGKTSKHTLSAIVKPGFGFVMPRTDVTIFGSRMNNRWHIAGACAGLETGLQATFWRHLTFEFTGKAVGASYARSLVQGKGNGYVSHYMRCVEAIFCFGYTF